MKIKHLSFSRNLCKWEFQIFKRNDDVHFILISTFATVYKKNIIKKYFAISILDLRKVRWTFLVIFIKIEFSKIIENFIVEK